MSFDEFTLISLVFLMTAVVLALMGTIINFLFLVFGV